MLLKILIPFGSFFLDSTRAASASLTPTATAPHIYLAQWLSAECALLCPAILSRAALLYLDEPATKMHDSRKIMVNMTEDFTTVGSHNVSFGNAGKFNYVISAGRVPSRGDLDGLLFTCSRKTTLGMTVMYKEIHYECMADYWCKLAVDD